MSKFYPACSDVLYSHQDVCISRPTKSLPPSRAVLLSVSKILQHSLLAIVLVSHSVQSMCLLHQAIQTAMLAVQNNEDSLSALQAMMHLCCQSYTLFGQPLVMMFQGTCWLCKKVSDGLDAAQALLGQLGVDDEQRLVVQARPGRLVARQGITRLAHASVVQVQRQDPQPGRAEIGAPIACTQNSQGDLFLI